MRWSVLLRLLFVMSSLGSLAACTAKGETCTVPEGASPDWIRVIGCAHDYELLVSEREDSIFSRTTTLNWIVDREDNNRTYFVNTREWRLHYLFASEYLNRTGLSAVGTHAEFNILNYRRPNRRFILGKIIHYLDQDLLTLEFSAGDTASVDLIVEGYRHVSKKLYDGDTLLYRPVSNDQEAVIDAIAKHIPVIRTEEVFRGQHYQPLNRVEGYGTLRFREVAQLGGQPLSPTDIVVLDRVPNDISLVSGIVTSEFQTPLSHVNLLSKNRGIPNMGLRDAYNDASLRALEGKLVKLKVGSQGFRIEETSLSEAQVFWDSLRPKEDLIPVFDESVDRIVDVSNAGIEDTISIGAKAANIGEMNRIEGVDIPLPDRAMALPFVWYQRHLVTHGIDTEIASLLSGVRLGTLEAAEIRTKLFQIRWRIYQAPMNADDLVTLESAILARWPSLQRLRFRSSTNVEDLASFSGAGLYTSTGASLDEGRTAIADAVRVVWASAWNEQAFVEREFYRVRHENVRMGVLIHPAFRDELANGVAVTINEFAENRPAFYINSQVGEVSVTNPQGDAIAEQILYYTWYEEPEYEVITRSSLLGPDTDWPAGQRVFYDEELAVLVSLLEKIHNHFRPLYPRRNDFAMDVEFKMVEGRRFVIKQARPLAH